ncbi:TonB family protein [Olivibacter sp. XZL3]|uniref:TonB family protein n=1 Tax=Olivibacter sp. XZL3 TaxID=1735116 RepID=UPI00351A26F2
MYPQEALDHRIEGLVSITFEISKKGEPVNFHIRRGIGYGCEEAVIAAVKSIRRKPAIAEGSITNFKMEATLYFALE